MKQVILTAVFTLIATIGFCQSGAGAKLLLSGKASRHTACATLQQNVDAEKYKAITPKMRVMDSETIALLAKNNPELAWRLRSAQNKPPIPIIEVESGMEGYYTFDAEKSFDPDGRVVMYYWFVDEVKIVGRSVTNIGQRFTPGTHKIKLTVQDNFGRQSSVTKIVQTK